MTDPETLLLNRRVTNLKQGIHTHYNDDIVQEVDSPSLVGRTSPGRGPVEKIEVEFPLRLEAKKLSLDQFELGAAAWHDGEGAPPDTLGADGDYYLDAASGDVYAKDLGAWAPVANIAGPQGEPGPIGLTGAAGPQGEPGPQGTTGAEGPQGLQGLQGEQGPQGTPGAAGAPGAVWRNGEGAPSDALGIDGDFYLDTANGWVYARSGGTYSHVATIIGPTGATGETGPQGPQGDPGPEGSAAQHGTVRLSYVSATQLKLSPHGGGDAVRINGTIKHIGGAGITAANTGVYVNGTAGQNLAANTNYLVCLFDNSGTLTFDFRSTLTHETDTAAGNEGVEIRAGDSTRSVIGLIRTNASSQFVDTVEYRFVRSWFNRETLRLRGTNGSWTGAPYTSVVELTSGTRVHWINWAGETVMLSATGSVWSSYMSAFYHAMMIDGTFDGTPMSCISNYADGYSREVGVTSNFEPSEGYHYGNWGAQATGNVTTHWSYFATVGFIFP